MSSIYDTYEPVIIDSRAAQHASKAYCGDATHMVLPEYSVPDRLGHQVLLSSTSGDELCVKLGIAVIVPFVSAMNLRGRTLLCGFAERVSDYAGHHRSYRRICTHQSAENIQENQPDPYHGRGSGKSVHDIDPFNTLVDLNVQAFLYWRLYRSQRLRMVKKRIAT